MRLATETTHAHPAGQSVFVSVDVGADGRAVRSLADFTRRRGR